MEKYEAELLKKKRVFQNDNWLIDILLNQLFFQKGKRLKYAPEKGFAFVIHLYLTNVLAIAIQMIF